MGNSETKISSKHVNPKSGSVSPMGATAAWTDPDLIAEAKKGGQWAFAELMQRHQVPLLRLALRISRDWDTAEDIVQDSFIKAYQKLHGFEGRSSFKSWIFQIGINTAKNKLRGHRRFAVPLENVTVNTQSRVDKEMAINDLKELVQVAVNELPERQRLALVLRIYEDMSFKEIADVMGCPYDTAKANYRHALLKLKNKISADEYAGYFHDFHRLEEINISMGKGETNK